MSKVENTFVKMSESVEIFDGVDITCETLQVSGEKSSTSPIVELCRKLLKNMEYESVVEFIAMHFMELTKSDGVCIYTKHSHAKFGTHLTKACACAAVQHIKKAIISKDTSLDPRFARHDATFTGRHAILFPLYYRGEFIGSLMMSRRVEEYTLANISTFILPMLEICSRFVYRATHSTKAKRLSVQQLKDVDDVKDRFLATMSHELRTPLNGIVGMVTLLESSGGLNAKQTEYVGILLECSHQLMNLMNNILDFSKMTSGRLVLARTPFSVTKTVRDSLLIAAAKAKDKKLAFNVFYNGKAVAFQGVSTDVAPPITLSTSRVEPQTTPLNVSDSSDGTPFQDPYLPYMIGDAQRLMQILINLLTNAVKFTDSGSIILRINSEPAYTNSSNAFVKKWRLVFEVEDTGVGVPYEEQARIFELFHQSPSLSEKVSKSGTGLGLSISKELVKLMGGNISVKSSGVKGNGSIFTFDVILDEELTLASTSEDYSKLFRKARILVVDDRQENRLQISEMLFKWKASPVILGSGEEALQYLKHDSNFSVALVDICMPYMSGIELAQELRSSYPNLALIGLSSLDNTTGKEIFDHYLTKPIDQTLIFPAILGCLIESKKRRGSQCGSSSSDTHGVCVTAVGGRREKKLRSKLRILIAEDDKNNAYTIQEMLYHLGYSKSRIKHVTNGEECVAAIAKGKHRYDVVLLDILMPVMNGLEAAKHIRQTHPHPYIIAVSAAVQKSDKQRCQQAGIDSYLTKPILIEKLAASLAPLVSDCASSSVKV